MAIDSVMDRVDRAILAHLVADSSITNVDLAERVHLSPSTCLRRIRALERSGVIVGYHAELNAEAMQQGFEVAVRIDLSGRDQATLEAFEAAVAVIDEIIHAQRMFGQPDYLLLVAVADKDAYEAVYMNRLTALPGVASVISQYTMKTIKTRHSKSVPRCTA